MIKISELEEQKIYKLLDTRNTTKTIEFFYKHQEDMKHFIEQLENDLPEKRKNYFENLKSKSEDELDKNFIKLAVKYYITFKYLNKVKSFNDKIPSLKVYLDRGKEIEIEDKNNKDDNFWYRGQTNEMWKLQPSFYRNINNCLKIKKNGVIDIKYLEKDYESKGLTYKYKSVFSYKMNYEFLSYMQHAVSYSPLIDFTDSPSIAQTFALSNKNQFNEFNYVDSALFELHYKKVSQNNEVENRDFFDNVGKVFKTNVLAEANDFINRFQIVYFDKYKIGSDIGRKKNPNVNDIINSLIPDVIMVDVPTNDRMKYQQGKFVLFTNCMILGDSIFYNLNSNISFVEYKIKCSDKQNILDNINGRYPQYSEVRLLNPYLWLNE